MEEILIEGRWQPSAASGSFHAANPATGEQHAREFPISSWEDCDRALTAAAQAAVELRSVDGEQIARFLEGYAEAIENRAEEIAALANSETALPVSPRLRDVELPRTTAQLRQAAAAAREGSWSQAVIDTRNNIRSYLAPIGPVVVLGPNNFPLAFNGISGGDFAAAIAAGNPVIAKAHPLHPATSQALAECALSALQRSGLPAATVQMLYHFGNDDGLRLVADPRVGASAFTGSRAAGLSLKQAADRAGKPIYLEMSSLNPVVLLPGALQERGDALVKEVADSGLAAAGQFCTSPNLLFLLNGAEAQRFAEGLRLAYKERSPGPLLSRTTLDHLERGVQQLVESGAAVLTGGGSALKTDSFCYPNTVLQTSGREFIRSGEALQQEAFGNVITLVLCDDLSDMKRALQSLDGNLTGSVYSHTGRGDEAAYGEVAAALRTKVGRLLNDKMPTGVALSPAMNHGGPFPATGHPGFTAVGIPRSIHRFAMLECYDNVRQERLPAMLRDAAPSASAWRNVDGAWVRG